MNWGPVIVIHICVGLLLWNECRVMTMMISGVMLAEASKARVGACVELLVAAIVRSAECV